VGAFVLFGGATLLLWRIAILLGCSPRMAFWATTAFAIGNPVLYYVFRRPLMSHAAEFFWFCAATLLLLRYFDAATPRSRTALAAGLGLSAGMLAITRLNDAPMAVAFIAGMLVDGRARGHRVRAGLVGLLGTAVPIAFLGGELWAQLHGSPAPSYDPAAHWAPMWPLTLAHLERVVGFFVGGHWGIVLLTPFVALELVAICVRGRRLLVRVAPRPRLVAVFALASGMQLLVASSFYTAGMSYGARFVFPVYWLLHLTFLLAIGSAPSLEVSPSRWRRRLVMALAAALVLVGTLNLASFESAPDLTLRMTLVREEGVSNPEFATLEGWAAPHFATEALKNIPSGRPVLAFGTSPAVWYACRAANAVLGAAAPIPHALEDYYRRRGMSSTTDLRALLQYHLVVLLLTGIAAACLWRAGRNWAPSPGVPPADE
jgi:hypothetical protein